MGRSWWGAVLVVYLLAGCAPMRTTPPAPPPVIDGVQLGVASWYGPGFHGNRTANGEIYDQYELTAAHRTLPLGTRVMVTNLSNGRAVEVRINDRGPFVGGRAIDLSYAAACVLHVVGPGTARVRIEVLPPATQVAERTGAPPQPPPVRYLVQVASLADPARAQHLRRVLGTRFPDAHVALLDTDATRYYRVLMGPYALRAAAAARSEMMTRLGYPVVIMEDWRP